MSGAVPGAGHFIVTAVSRSVLRRPGAAIVIFAALMLMPVGAPGAAMAAARTAARETVSRPHVYLMRGLLNIFSLGMDQLAAQIARHGIDAGVYNHTLEGVIVEQITQMYRGGDHGPYILVGHSLGADAVMTMAQQLSAQGVPVALVVPFDGTSSYAAPRNVACVLNLTQRRYAYMRASAGFHGMLSNVDVSNDASIDHFTIDKSPRLQAEALRYVLQTAHGQSCRPDGTGPVEARPKQAPMPRVTPAKTASPGLRPGIAG